MDQRSRAAVLTASSSRYWKPGWMAGAIALAAGLVVLGFEWPRQAGLSLPALPALLQTGSGHTAESPLAGLLKLLIAALIGIVISAIQRQAAGAKESRRAVEQAQVLLTVAGALTVLLIGDSLARALGVAGGAAIIRFRTPVDSPKDATVLYLLMGLGMASGLGFFAVAGMGTLLLAVMLLVLGPGAKEKSSKALVDVVASGPEFPTEMVENTLARHVAKFRVCRISRGSRASVRYQVAAGGGEAVSNLSRELMAAADLHTVAWQPAGRES